MFASSKCCFFGIVSSHTLEVDCEALNVQRNAPRWIKMLRKQASSPRPLPPDSPRFPLFWPWPRLRPLGDTTQGLFN
jgi:hypothetical protein